MLTNTIVKILLNTIFVSIPEEIVMVMVILYISNKSLINSFDLTRFKINKKVVLIPAIISAVISNVIRYNGLQDSYFAALPYLATFIGVLIVNIFYNYENKSKFKIFILTIAGLFAAMFLLLITDSIFGLLILFITHSNLDNINNNIFLNFICSLPGRIIQYLILFLLLVKYNKKINILTEIWNQTIINKISSIIYITINIIMMILVTIFVNASHMSTSQSIIILSIGFCYLLVLTFISIIVIYSIVCNQKY